MAKFGHKLFNHEKRSQTARIKKWQPLSETNIIRYHTKVRSEILVDHTSLSTLMISPKGYSSKFVSRITNGLALVINGDRSWYSFVKKKKTSFMIFQKQDFFRREKQTKMIYFWSYLLVFYSSKNTILCKRFLTKPTNPYDAIRL